MSDSYYDEPEQVELVDQGAESMVLAAALDQPGLIKLVAELPNDLFVAPLNRLIHETVTRLVLANEPVDHMTVSRRAASLAMNNSQATSVQARVLALMGKGMTGGIAFHIDRLQALAAARTVTATAQKLIQYATESVRADEPSLLSDGVANAIVSLGDAQQDTTAPTESDLPISLQELLDDHETPASIDDHDWIIEGMLERTDRLVLTSFEGIGKSHLLAQIGLCTAAGLHPFLGHPIGDGCNVLAIDAENSSAQTARRYRHIRGMVENMCRRHKQPIPDWSKQYRFDIRPEGIELNDPRILKRIHRKVAAAEPDLVIMGPLYRLHRLDTRDEQAAKELTDAIDGLRVRHRFAVLAEAHVAHGGGGRDIRALRPTGSSLFLRWPEFGMGLRPTKSTADEEHPSEVDFVAWRGGREERVWPTTLHHHYKDLPWMADSGYANKLAQNGFL